MALNITFSSSINKPSRYLGGAGETHHPFIKGFFYVFFQFSDYAKNEFAGLSGEGQTLLSLCQGYDAPGDRQIITEDVNGMGGLDASFMVKQQHDRNFSLRFSDTWDSPVFKVHRALTSYIDPLFGGILAKTNKNYEFIPREYKMKVMVIHTKPVAIYGHPNENNNDLENLITKVHLFDGVIPKTDLVSIYGNDINDNSIIKPTIQYGFDGTFIDETINAKLKEDAANLLKNKIKGKESKRVDDISTFEAN